MRRLLCLAAACAPALLPSPAAAQDADVLARVDRPTPVAAYGGRVAWSVRDPATDRFALVSQTAGGVPAPLPVAPRGVPFDVDLGPGPDGGVTACTSRCRDRAAELRADGQGRGCDVYAFDFAAGTERRVAAVSSPSASEAWPTIHRERIAFARLYDNKRDYPYLYVDAGGGSVRQCPAASATRARAGSARTTAAPSRSSSSSTGAGSPSPGATTDFAEGFAYDLRLDDVQASDGDPRRIAHAGGGGLSSVRIGWPGFEDGRLYWSQSCFGDPGGCAGRRALLRSPYTGDIDRHRAGPGGYVWSHDRAGGASYLVRDTFGGGGTECRGDPDVPGGTCEVVRAVPAFG